MGRPARQIVISDEEELQLMELELDGHAHPKTRLRASLLRLHRAGWTVAQLAARFDRNVQAVHNDLTRFEQWGLAGLADGRAPGKAPVVTPKIDCFLHETLLRQPFWTASLLSDAVAERFQVTIGSRAMINHLHRLGYSWERGCPPTLGTLNARSILQHIEFSENPERPSWRRKGP